eukprot:TRINITY_DN10611_c0_g1_i2.p2 TRINITY_DN10611_c0_g1~~TRINITY_DN10611_c0_g1_i2.p2  ORF type:complete len:151 (-),score=44.19 TRINITY_DN10611_c0_g1_i2:569-1021(-)
MFDFDYDVLESIDPSPDPEEVCSEDVAQRAAVSLQSKAFAERRNACRCLGEIGASAEPYLPLLLTLAEKDEDYEVRKAAKSAVRLLKAKTASGAQLKTTLDTRVDPEIGGTGDALKSISAISHSVQVNFQIFDKVKKVRQRDMLLLARGA